MNLLKYLIAGGISLIISLAAIIMGNLLSGILVFVLLLGVYILFNYIKQIERDERDRGNPPVLS